MEQVDYNDERQERRKRYQHLTETVKYASACEMLGDKEGELVALKHAVELTLDLLERYYPEKRRHAEDVVELDGMREMSRAVQDIQEAGQAPEEGAQEAHVVPVVQVRDASSGEVLNLVPKKRPKDSHHGTNGINPKRGVSPRRFRIYELDESGEPTGNEDEGTAQELAERNAIGLSSIYKRAGHEPKPGAKWRIEKVD